MKVYEAITDAFVAEGVDVVFSLMGDSNMMFHDDLVRRHGVRVVNARHENATVAMADGYARATGRVGVATVTCGPGLTQVATALTAATRLRVPLVVFVGDTPTKDLWNPQQLDFGATILPTGASHFPIKSAERIAETVAFAFLSAARDRRPAVLTMPYDLQEQELTSPFAPKPSSRFATAAPIVAPAPESVEAAVAAILAAERPIVVAGRGAIVSGARDEVLRLAAQAGALVATSLKAKNWLDGEEWSIGVSGSLGSATSRELAKGADLVIGIGAQLGSFHSESGRLYEGTRILHIDLEPANPVEGFPFDGVLVRADARLGAAAVADALEAAGPARPGYRTEATAKLLADPLDDWRPGTPEAGRVDPTLAMRAMDEAAAAAPDQQFVFGVGHYWSFAVMNTHRPDPTDFLYAYGFGSIGHALPVAIGAAIGRERPVLLVDGDGGLLMHVGELGTVADEGLDITIVVMDDGGYGSEIHKLTAKGGDGELARFHQTDFATVAAGFGIEGHKVSTPEELAELVADQRATKAPRLIHVPMVRDALSPSMRRNCYPNG